jgi:signal peptidase I
MTLRWFTSSQVRDAVVMRKHVRRLLCAQRDILAPTAIEHLNRALMDLSNAVQTGLKGEALKKEMAKLEEAANKWLKPYPHAAWRENVEVLLVALAVAMAIRTFFVQPFKIPTGSMQPTLFGVTQDSAYNQPDFKMPTGWERVKQWFAGVSYVHVVAQNDGELQAVNPPFRILIFNIWQKLVIGGVEQTIWFPPDYGEAPPYPDPFGRQRQIDPFVFRARLEPGRIFHKGEDVAKVCMRAGDHLFVDRLSYNFRKPDRGDIIVFETAGIAEEMRNRYHIPADQFYIKRLVGLPGEKMWIGDDRHVRVNGERLDASTPHFENVYGFNPNTPPRDSQFSGHVNGTVAQEYNLSIGILPLFPDQTTVYDVSTNCFMPMGDNTCNSLDSRFFGGVPERYAIGKAFFVYWPITDRFGWGNR